MEPPVPAPPIDWSAKLRDLRGSNQAASLAAAEAFSAVIRRTLRRAGAYERRADWEDLIHDVLLALFENADAVKAPVSWLRSVAYNAYMDWLRKESSQAARLREFSDLQSLLRPDDPAAHPDAWVSRREELDELHAAIARLPEGPRSIVDGVYPSDPTRELTTLADVARELGLKLHTVKNGLRAGLQRLGRELRRERKLGRFRKAEPKAAPSGVARAQRSRARRRLRTWGDPRTEP